MQTTKANRNAAIATRQRVIVPESLVEAVSNREKVMGAPHDFYRYPARFSPLFAREAIKTFTEHGDFVLDPFCGGGTTLVEALSLGRRAAGMDVSSTGRVFGTHQDDADFSSRQTGDSRMARPLGKGKSKSQP